MNEDDKSKVRLVTAGGAPLIKGPSPTPQRVSTGEDSKRPIATDAQVADMPARPRERADKRMGRRSKP